MQGKPPRGHRWGVILAGGEGMRLRSLTRLVSSVDKPKQFCRLLGGQTLLSQTRDRVARSIPKRQTLFVLLRSHERFYSHEMEGVPSIRMIVQPCNRGTLPAILRSLMHIHRVDERAVAAFYPSDHYYSDERNFTVGVELAFESAERDPHSVILLGAPATRPETGYGWIEAEAAVSINAPIGLLRVKQFREKPSPRARRGSQTRRMKAVYEPLPITDFSSRVLSASPEKLGVLSLGDLGWRDLGDPQQLMEVWSRTGEGIEWNAPWHRNEMNIATS